MAGVLSFTLGLETHSFLRGLGLASGNVISLAGAMEGLQKIAAGTWDAMERGGRLVDLSNRTRETVGNLFQLEEGFKQVGLGAENVGPMINRMQRALAGVDESGNKTDQVFSSLGLSLEQLRAMDAPARFEALASAMSKLNSDQAAGVAARLFGREGSANFMQLAQDFEGFKDSLKESAASAAVFARNAMAFDKVGDTLTTIKMKFSGMFAGIAEGAAPALQKLLDWVNGQDWVGFGTRLGNEITVAFQAADLGKFGEYFTLVMQSAVQETMNFMMRKIMEFKQWQESGPKFNGKWGVAASGVAAGLFGLWDEAGAQLGIPGARELSDKRFDQAYAAFEESGLNGGFLSSISEAFVRGIEGAPNEFAERLKVFREEMLRVAEASRTFSNTVQGIAKDHPSFKNQDKTAATALEKMGFITNGGHSSSDYIRSTADNTKRLVELTLKILNKRPDLADVNYANLA